MVSFSLRAFATSAEAAMAAMALRSASAWASWSCTIEGERARSSAAQEVVAWCRRVRDSEPWFRLVDPRVLWLWWWPVPGPTPWVKS